MAKQASKYPATLLAVLRVAAKGVRSRRFAGTLLALTHLLEEFLGLLFVGKGEPGHAIVDLEAVEEDTVLFIRPLLVDFIVPYDSSQ